MKINPSILDGWEILKESEDLVILKHNCGAELTFEGYKSDGERAIRAIKEHKCKEKSNAGDEKSPDPEDCEPYFENDDDRCPPLGMQRCVIRPRRIK